MYIFFKVLVECRKILNLIVNYEIFWFLEVESIVVGKYLGEGSSVVSR